MDSSVAGRQCRVHQEHHAPHAVGRLRGDPSKSCVFDSLDFFFHFTEFEILLNDYRLILYSCMLIYDKNLLGCN